MMGDDEDAREQYPGLCLAKSRSDWPISGYVGSDRGRTDVRTSPRTWSDYFWSGATGDLNDL
jgi:hypothetical protein